MEQPFEEKEILESLHCLDGEKTSGPDGFTSAFFQCWGVIKEDMIKCFNHFHTTESFEKSLNATLLLSSFLRKEGTNEANDFRHIGLVGVCIS